MEFTDQRPLHCRHLSTDHHLLFFFLFRVCEQQTTTPQLLRMTPCWCLTMRAAALPPALSAPSTPPAQGTRTMTTSTTGVPASRSWPTCTEEGMMIKPAGHTCTHTTHPRPVSWPAMLCPSNTWGCYTLLNTR